MSAISMSFEGGDGLPAFVDLDEAAAVFLLLLLADGFFAVLETAFAFFSFFLFAPNVLRVVVFFLVLGVFLVVVFVDLVGLVVLLPVLTLFLAMNVEQKRLYAVLNLATRAIHSKNPEFVP